MTSITRQEKNVKIITVGETRFMVEGNGTIKLSKLTDASMKDLDDCVDANDSSKSN